MTLRDGKNLETRMWDLEEKVRKKSKGKILCLIFILGIMIIGYITMIVDDFNTVDIEIPPETYLFFIILIMIVIILFLSNI